MAKMMGGDKCTCTPANFLWMVIAAIVMGVGLWLLIGGLQGQWQGGTWQTVLTWYALGFLVMGIGKMFKHKSSGMCPVHGCGHMM